VKEAELGAIWPSVLDLKPVSLVRLAPGLEYRLGIVRVVFRKDQVQSYTPKLGAVGALPGVKGPVRNSSNGGYLGSPGGAVSVGAEPIEQRDPGGRSQHHKGSHRPARLGCPLAERQRPYTRKNNPGIRKVYRVADIARNEAAQERKIRHARGGYA
jgi:hypothetical protein